jgi:hypothetical protein
MVLGPLVAPLGVLPAAALRLVGAEPGGDLVARPVEEARARRRGPPDAP